MELACNDCSTRWTPPEPSPAKEAAGAALLAIAACCAPAMLWFLHRNETTVGGALGIGALATMGVGVKLRGSGLPRCPQCGRLGRGSDPGEGSE